jgi:hypothetical protein
MWCGAQQSLPGHASDARQSDGGGQGAFAGSYGSRVGAPARFELPELGVEVGTLRANLGHS